MSTPFSVVIPVYNTADYLHECIQSVLNQSFADVEVICINDGSTDSSGQILEHYATADTRVKVITQENSGLSYARNRGIEISTGAYLLFLDSDDWLEKHALQVLSVQLTDEDILCFNGRRFHCESGEWDCTDNLVEYKNCTGWDYYTKNALEKRKFHFVCSVLRLYKREFLMRHRLRFEPGLLHEDNLFTPIVLFFAGNVSCISDCLYNYRLRPGSISTSDNSRRILDLVTVANRLSAFFISKPCIDKTAIFREIAGEYFKGFMPEERTRFGTKDKELVQKIHWPHFKTVSTYPRHRRIYWLLWIHPALFRLYIHLESILKKLF